MSGEAIDTRTRSIRRGSGHGMSERWFVEAVSKDLLTREDKFRKIDAHDLAEAIGVSDSRNPGHIYSEQIGEIQARLLTGRGGNHAGEAFVLVTGPGATRPGLHEVAHIKYIGKFATACLEPADAPELILG
jgi:hypothetical protein